MMNLVTNNAIGNVDIRIDNVYKFNTREGLEVYASKKNVELTGVRFLNFDAYQTETIANVDRIIDAIKTLANRQRVLRLADYVRKIRKGTGIETDITTIKRLATQLGLLVVDKKVFGRAVIAA